MRANTVSANETVELQTSTLLSPYIFREYDIRGVAGVDITAEIAFRIGHAFGVNVIADGGKRVCAAYDGRLSSPELARALCHGLVSAGCHVLNFGLGPTPMLYFGVCFLEADAGIIVTGSHNPPQENGFKFMRANRSFYGEDIRRLYEAVRANTTSMPDISSWPQVENYEHIHQHYLHRLCTTFTEVNNPKQRPLKVAWDPGNGATGNLVAALCEKLPGKHRPINSIVDGTFPAHHPDPSLPENLQQLMGVVKKQQCDIGLAFDGDGDRIGVVDDKGEMLSADQLIMLFAAEVLQKQPKATVIADVKSSQVVFEEIARLGGTPLMWKTGHSLIKAKMKEAHAPLAGEQSGHIFFADEYYGFDDGLYAAVRLLRLLSQSQVPLSQWRKTLPMRYNTPEIRLPCSDEKKFGVIEAVRTHMEKQGAAINAIDGIRVKRDNGWWLLRASNTQPMLIVRWEANDKSGMRELEEELRNTLASHQIDLPAYANREMAELA